jgi:hypothetical protein
LPENRSPEIGLIATETEMIARLTEFSATEINLIGTVTKRVEKEIDFIRRETEIIGPAIDLIATVQKIRGTVIDFRPLDPLKIDRIRLKRYPVRSDQPRVRSSRSPLQ